MCRTFLDAFFFLSGFDHPFMNQKPCAKEDENIGYSYPTNLTPQLPFVKIDLI